MKEGDMMADLMFELIVASPVFLIGFVIVLVGMALSDAEPKDAQPTYTDEYGVKRYGVDPSKPKRDSRGRFV
jgi:hypothetical protein